MSVKTESKDVGKLQGLLAKRLGVDLDDVVDGHWDLLVATTFMSDDMSEAEMLKRVNAYADAVDAEENPVKRGSMLARQFAPAPEPTGATDDWDAAVADAPPQTPLDPSPPKSSRRAGTARRRPADTQPQADEGAEAQPNATEWRPEDVKVVLSLQIYTGYDKHGFPLDPSIQTEELTTAQARAYLEYASKQFTIASWKAFSLHRDGVDISAHPAFKLLDMPSYDSAEPYAPNPHSEPRAMPAGVTPPAMPQAPQAPAQNGNGGAMSAPVVAIEVVQSRSGTRGYKLFKDGRDGQQQSIGSVYIESVMSQVDALFPQFATMGAGAKMPVTGVQAAWTKSSNTNQHGRQYNDIIEFGTL